MKKSNVIDNFDDPNFHRLHPELITSITGRDRLYRFDQNTLAMAACGGMDELVDPLPLKSNLSGKTGVFEYKSIDMQLFLSKEEITRLHRLHLRKSEYLRLAEVYGPDTYIIHDDFYAEDGTALQPH